MGKNVSEYIFAFIANKVVSEVSRRGMWFFWVKGLN